MNEFELIQQYFSRANYSSTVSVGIGDDCAVVSIPEHAELALSVDTLLPGVHFFPEAAPALIAERALSVCLSDLAAMGAEPLWFTLALTLPEADEAWLSGFSEGLFLAAKRYHCELIGGNTSKGPLSISIQVQGAVPKDGAIVRSGARVGDLVCVSGPLGDGAAALAMLKGELDVDAVAYSYFNDAYYRPQPQLNLGQKLRGLASAAIDISDGFLADLGHICKASGVGAHINVESLPLSSALVADSNSEQWQQWALTGGDDYQLCFTVAEDKAERLHQLIEANQFTVSVIGHIVEGAGVECKQFGQPIIIVSNGYTHF
ncbi:MAG: thiamine-monophosphate kinase [Lentisphaeria bacterium]